MCIRDSINVGLNSQSKLGQLFINTSISNPYAVGLSVFGQAIFNGTVQIKSGTPGLGKVLTSDAAGNVSWQTAASTGGGTTAPGYGIEAIEGAPGYNRSTVCIINISSGETTCSEANPGPVNSSTNVSWGNADELFAAGSNGPYGLTCTGPAGGYNKSYCCRVDKSGSSECKYSASTNQAPSSWPSFTSPY